MRRWTWEEINFLKNNYQTMAIPKLAQKINRSPASVRSKMKQLKLTKRRVGHKWAEADLVFLRENYPTITLTELSQNLQRTPAAILHKVNQLQLHKEVWNPWTKEEILYLQEQYPTTDLEELLHHLDRSPEAIKSQVHRLQLRKEKWEWTTVEREYLKEKFTILPLSTLAQHMNRTPEAIYRQARQLGLHKDRVPWSKKEVHFLIDQYGYYLSPRELASKLNRSLQEIDMKSWELRLHWTNEEVVALEDNYSEFSDGELATQLDKPVRAITRKRRELGLLGSRSWTEEDTIFLKANYNLMNISELSRQLGFTKKTVRQHLNELEQTQGIVPADLATRKLHRAKRQENRQKSLNKLLDSLLKEVKIDDPQIINSTHTRVSEIVNELITHPAFKHQQESKFELLALAIISLAYEDIVNTNRLPFDLPLKMKRNVLKKRLRLKKAFFEKNS